MQDKISKQTGLNTARENCHLIYIRNTIRITTDFPLKITGVTKKCLIF